MTDTTRLTPYELAFPPDPFEEQVFPSILAEAEARNVSIDAAEQFLMLGTVGQQLRELRPESEDVPSDQPLPPAQAVREYGALLFHAFRFWQNGRTIFAVDEAVVRTIAEDHEPAGEWTFRPPNDSGYVEMPRHILWARIDDTAPAEAVDGFFWTVVEPTVGRPGRLELLLVLGMHPARPGFSVVEASGPLPPPPPGHWADIVARAENDFGNILPGGELRQLLALTSVPETLKFVSRLFRYIALWPDRVHAAAAPVSAEPESPHELRPSTLAASRVRIAD
jgi:hypothetical protein